MKKISNYKNGVENTVVICIFIGKSEFSNIQPMASSSHTNESNLNAYF